MSATIHKLAAALVKVQRQLPPVPKSKTVEIATPSGGKESYSYAPLDAVWECCRQLLTENGLAIAQISFEADGYPHLETILMHTSGQWLSSTLPLVATRDPQQLGSALTYMRRYALTSLVGIVADEDDDGRASKPRKGSPQDPQHGPNGQKGAVAQKARFLINAKQIIKNLPKNNLKSILKQFDLASLEDIEEGDRETMVRLYRDLETHAQAVAAGR